VFSDGTRVVSIQRDVVNIWPIDTPTHNQDMARHHTNKVNRISFSRDGQLVASGSEDYTVEIWDTLVGQCPTTFRDHLESVKEATFSPDSKLCASWGLDQAIRIWNVHTGNPVFTFCTYWDGLLCHMYFSLDGSRLGVPVRDVSLSGEIVGCRERRLRRFDVSLILLGVHQHLI
jgi:WD40 repeat protein